jgi:hypothetical protein
MVDVWKSRAEAMKAAAQRKGSPKPSTSKPASKSLPSAYHAKNAIQVKSTNKPKPKGDGMSMSDYFHYGVVGGKKRRDAERAAERSASTRTSSKPSNAADAKRYIADNKTKAMVHRAAQKRSETKMRLMDREDRKRRGDFKGKYWGPDKFKGNQQKIDAWKKAGKPRNADGTPKG